MQAAPLSRLRSVPEVCDRPSSQPFNTKRPVMNVRPALHGLFSTIVLVGVAPLPGAADEFTYRDAKGESITVSARLAGSEQGSLALEKADGAIDVIPQAAVTKRVPGDGPDPLTPDQMEARLKERFGDETFRSLVQRPFVVGLVLSEPLNRTEEARTKVFLQKVARFMKRIEGVFDSYTKSARFRSDDVKYPLVVLVFETDDEFDDYTKTVMKGGRGLAAANISGFYDGLTNWLALRLSECHDFAVPLHEAIHQQVYNRGVVQRLSPVPKWFHEGIATGFEGNGDRISVGPNRISKRFAELALQPTRIDWDVVANKDAAFGANVLAGDAYTHAWSMHWLLVTRYKDQYSEYVAALSKKKTLEKESEEQRRDDFKNAFGKTPAELQKEFAAALQLGLKRQKIRFDKPQAGLSRAQRNLADVAVTAVNRNGALHVQGKMMNISPIREMAYYITIETNAGLYADWYIPRLPSRRTTNLKPQIVRKRMANAPGGYSATFRVRVRAVTPDSDAAKGWRENKFPVPVFGG